jgi:hypothetical protein
MSAAGGEADDLTPEDTGYKAPAQASVGEMNALDADDEALVKWKAQLLGAGGGAAVDGPKVQVIKMDLLSEGKTLTLDLTGDVAALKDYKMQVKEGVEYKIQVRGSCSHPPAPPLLAPPPPLSPTPHPLLDDEHVVLTVSAQWRTERESFYKV